MTALARSKKFLILALAAALTATLALPAAAAGAFDDDDGNTHEADIDFIANLDITRGCNPPANTNYCPDDFVTRAQMATFLKRAFNLPATSTDHFDDDDGNTHEADINAIAEARITIGCNPPANTNFCPNSFVTRAQMASFIIRALGDVKPFNGPVFADALRGETHTRDINALAGMSITRGCNPPTNDLFCGDDFVTRAQMASFLARVIRLGDQRPPEVEITSPAHLATFITSLDANNQFSVDLTLTATATDPNGDVVTNSRWDSTDDGFLGTDSPINTNLGIPTNQTSAQPFITFLAGDATGLFSGDEIQLKLIMPSP